MTKYVHENNLLDLYGGLGLVYKGDRLIFRGDGYVALKMFIVNCGNAPSVLARFKKQLDTRESCRWKSQDAQRTSDDKLDNMEKLSKSIEEEKPKQVKKRGR